jgi:hypothetical protein
MPKRELRERLAELHAELERSPAVDAESRQLLATLADDIHDVLDPEGVPTPDHTSLSERLTEAVREFEKSHPQLAAAVGRVADTLSNLGI